MRTATSPRKRSPLMLEPTGHCPYLGLKQNQAIRFASPTPEHRCYATGQAQEIPSAPLEYQLTFCLSANHVRCPLYTGTALPSTLAQVTRPEIGPALASAGGLRGWLAGLPPRDRAIYGLLLSLLGLILVIYAVAGVGLIREGGFAGGLPSPPPSPTEQPGSGVVVSSPTMTATVMPTATVTTTAQPSSTPTSSATPTASVLPTIEPVSPTPEPPTATFVPPIYIPPSSPLPTSTPGALFPITPEAPTEVVEPSPTLPGEVPTTVPAPSPSEAPTIPPIETSILPFPEPTATAPVEVPTSAPPEPPTPGPPPSPARTPGP